MPHPLPLLPPVDDLFRIPPARMAERVAKEWHRQHPEWTAAELTDARDVLLEVFRQARAWWKEHPNATHAQVRRLYSRIVAAYARGERLIPVPTHRQTPLRRRFRG